VIIQSATIGAVCGNASHAPNLSCEVHLANFRENDLGNKKIALDEGTKRTSDPIFVARQNGGVGNGNPEGVTEQDCDREPVGQPSDNRGFRPRAHQLDQPSR
jgi:hypothetical protein